jgi:hypothetical protein
MGAPVKNRGLGTLLGLAFALVSGSVSAAFDPTEPPERLTEGEVAAPREEAGLAWVRVNGRHSIAWYGGTAVKLGDPVEGGRVTAIREDHIVISGRDGKRTIYLLEGAVRKQMRAGSRPAR